MVVVDFSTEVDLALGLELVVQFTSSSCALGRGRGRVGASGGRGGRSSTRARNALRVPIAEYYVRFNAMGQLWRGNRVSSHLTFEHTEPDTQVVGPDQPFPPPIQRRYQ